jgi:PIN domain nuclease of toxin-antitoxin system
VVAVSAVSALEIAVKIAIGKLRMEARVADLIAADAFLSLPVTVRHGDVLRDLPRYHRDPFDRLLIVQALEEGLTLLTADRAFEPYRVPVEWM